MKIFINEKEMTERYSNLNLPQIFEEIKSNLEEKIIKKIIINEVEVNERYIKEALIEKKDIEKVSFVLQDTSELIVESLKEIDLYLPKLKKGCFEAADLFRNGDFNTANKKYQYILEGISWYSETITSLVNLLNQEDYVAKIIDKLTSLNKILDELLSAYENEDSILIADILEYEITDFIEDFIEINKNLIDISNNLKSK